MSKRLSPGLRAYFSAMGQKGGRIGGKRALETMTPAERSQRASKAGRVAAAVWRARRDALKKDE
jgi:hypothetical protein